MRSGSPGQLNDLGCAVTEFHPDVPVGIGTTGSGEFNPSGNRMALDYLRGLRQALERLSLTRRAHLTEVALGTELHPDIADHALTGHAQNLPRSTHRNVANPASSSALYQ